MYSKLPYLIDSSEGQVLRIMQLFTAHPPAERQQIVKNAKAALIFKDDCDMPSTKDLENT